jgi:ATP-dependent DNA helicase RecG
MLISEQNLLDLIQRGENLTLEFKECKNEVSRSAYETVCSFLNRHGGTLLLGVSDDGDITGINPNAVAQIRKDFTNTTNNPQKLNPTYYLTINEYQIEGKLFYKFSYLKVPKFIVAMDVFTIVTKMVILISPIIPN